MAADSQLSSQVGDISRFKDMLLIKPTEHEARLALRDFQSGLVVVVQAIRDKARAAHVVITLGAEGLLVHSETREASEGVTDQLPAFNRAPKDVAGGAIRSWSPRRWRSPSEPISGKAPISARSPPPARSVGSATRR